MAAPEMTSAALFDLLPDFGTRAKRAEPAAAASSPGHLPEPQAPQADIGTLIAEAVAHAEAALKERLDLAHREALDAERQAFTKERTAFLETIGGDLGKSVAARIDEMETRVAALVGATAARLIGGLLSDDLQKRALDELAHTIREAVGDAEAVRIKIRGPALLYEKLSASLGTRAANLDFTEAPGFDLTVSMDDAVFETRMAEWSGALSEVLS